MRTAPDRDVPTTEPSASTPLVFAVLVSVDVTAALAVAVAFAPEAVVGVAVLALLFLLGRRIVRGVRGLPKEDGH
jgi:hypothetical protein